MEMEIAAYNNIGMSQDASVSKAGNDKAFENRNIRITAIQDNTLLSITNEKGPLHLNNLDILGTFLGKCTIGDYIIIFTQSSTYDRITRIQRRANGSLQGTVIFTGKLNFDLNYPIEATSYYESETIQKVYWVDGLNPPRVINIVAEAVQDTTSNPYTKFDFTPRISSVPIINVTKKYEGKGLFHSGVIQYLVSYYNKYGSSTQIIATTGLNYITRSDRGGKADEVCTCSFDITVSNLDSNNFDYLRIYSVERNSLDGPRELKIVGDFDIRDKSNITITDTGINQRVLQDTDVYYLGGQYFVASTLDQKDNTLFFGDIKISDNLNIEGLTAMTESWYNPNTKESSVIAFGTKQVNTPDDQGVYIWNSELNKSSIDIQYFKYGELYRFAIQFMTDTGEWTQAFYIGDKVCDIKPSEVPSNSISTREYLLPCATFSANNFEGHESILSKFIGYRLLMADTTYGNRRILAQGILNPTVFNFDDRARGKVYSYSSWLTRPRGMNNTIESRHYVPIINEIQNSSYKSLQEADEKGLVPYSNGLEGTNYLIVLTIGAGHKVKGNIFLVTQDSSSGKNIINVEDSSTIKELNPGKAGTWDAQMAKLSVDAVNMGINVTDGLFPEASYMREVALTVSGLHTNTSGSNGFTHIYSGTSGDDNYYPLGGSRSIIPNIEVSDGTFYPMTGQYRQVIYKIIPAVAAGVSNGVQNKAYFPDEQFINLYSPDIENAADIIDGTNCSLKIVGIVPLTANFGDYTLQTSTSGLSVSATTVVSNIFSTSNVSNALAPIVSPYLWSDYGWNSDGEVDLGKLDIYRVFMWNGDTSLSGFTSTNSAIGLDDYPAIPSLLKHKVYSNMFFSNKTIYTDNSITYRGIVPAVYQDDGIFKSIYNEKSRIYSGQLDTLITTSGINDYYLPQARISTITGEEDTVFTDEESTDYFKLYDPIRIKYRGTPHVALALPNRHILPRLVEDSTETEKFEEEEWDLFEILTGREAGTDDNSAKYNIFPWLSNSTDGSPDFKFAGAYYLEDDNTEGLKARLNELEVTLPLNVEYIAVSLDTSKSIKPCYVYQESNTHEPMTLVQCFDLAHPGITVTFTIQDTETPEVIYTESRTLPAHDINAQQVGVASNIEILNMETTYPYGVREEAPAAISKTVKSFYKVKYTIPEGEETGDFVIEKLDSAPEGIFTMDAGRFEYYEILNAPYEAYDPNRYPIPQYMRFSGNNIIEVSSDELFRTHFSQEVLTVEEDEVPKGAYLLLAELYRDASGDELYGSTITNIIWNPISQITALDSNTTKTYGDTFYQRWDCLRTYPMTEEDSNSVVDIVSFMVESHINLDARVDINRGTTSILTARPSNYNLFNGVYNQLDTLFQYSTLDERFNTNQFSNQIVWSLPKTAMDDIDTWTQISLNNSLSLNGAYGPINEILNINDSIVVFQDNAIAGVQYNDRTMIPTETGVPIQLANSGKVTGYNYVTKSNGCRNKWSICTTSSGVYFIDDNVNTMFSFNKEGLKDISTSAGMSNWFNHNMNGLRWTPNNNGYRTNYDAITKDLYIANKDDCLVYNELLGNFTSFMKYEGKPYIFNLGSDSYITTLSPVNIYKMFGGDYNKTFNGTYIDYSIQYRINPEPLLDKTFTNIEFIADNLDPSKEVNDPSNYINKCPFDTLKVWNEYQEGETTLSSQIPPSSLKKKFRIWRADIPRDANSAYKLDRIRNPWINLKLKCTPNDTNKIVFHNMNIKYYK